MNATLLPSGLYDLLPPAARQESEALHRLLTHFSTFGYAQVSPPLMEFETTLLAGASETLAQQTLRIMDPLSQEMLAVRADMTPQIARIAGTRLKSAPRPLRLCYAGATLRVKAEALESDRQWTQTGIELIGVSTPDADAEIILVLVEALQALGAGQITVDMNLPGLLPLLLEGEQTTAAEREALLKIILQKDLAALAGTRYRNKDLLAALLQHAGKAETMLPKIAALPLPPAAKEQMDTLAEVVRLVGRSAPEVALSVDPVEARGFAYHQGIGFSLFVHGARREVGRGGRYRADGADATGGTLYVGALMQALPPPEELPRVLVARDVPARESHALRGQGYATLHALTGGNLRDEARRLGCAYVYEKGALERI